MKIETAQQITSQTHLSVLSTILQFSVKFPAISQGILRNLIFLSNERYTSNGKLPGNGLNITLVRIGRKLLIDEVRFFQWIEAQQSSAR